VSADCRNIWCARTIAFASPGTNLACQAECWRREVILELLLQPNEHDGKDKDRGSTDVELLDVSNHGLAFRPMRGPIEVLA
jgi:hypothetical protein